MSKILSQKFTINSYLSSPLPLEGVKWDDGNDIIIIFHSPPRAWENSTRNLPNLQSIVINENVRMGKWINSRTKIIKEGRN